MPNTVDRLRRLDLNLLVTLEALLTELNVTRAASRLHLSQPTVSLQLARLRDVLGDPLLLPGPRGMRPTARAEQLREPLRVALQALREAIAPPGAFEPANAELTWRVSASDYAGATVLQPALAGLRARAPRSRIAICPLSPQRLARQLEQGELDLAFHIAAESPPALRRRPLFHEHYVLAGRAGHPGLKRRPTLAQFCRLDHAVVSQDEGGFYGVTDMVLAQQGMQRNVVLSVPHFLVLRSVLATTDLVAMVPARLIRGATELRAVRAPLDIPGFDMVMLWHERLHRDPAHQWLREQIARSTA
ncbi:LysR family transcriptional regulator [Bordetella genomosp. 7]|uniref:LysR family transcriptional regulator n=1 Tax=Bordetella genomosp. 7 TaxID=1416805 RepID=A0A261RQD8_9BORD|nr:LysR family transcriptional regulator [Bordetella genomosp. 7]OZI27266.1 LysR family transcriptional regulator [Bordetella genomosp. 7]OZI29396.1 LysR family transcriptional regulator [Bordetella genomosp. 7]